VLDFRGVPNHGAIVERLAVAVSELMTTSGATTASRPVWRLVSEGGDHLYTRNWKEAVKAQTRLNYVLECDGKPAFLLADRPVNGAVPFYQFFNGKDHFYTTSRSAEGAPYHLEGVLGYIFTSPGDGRIPLYRAFNPKSGDHFYTTSKPEYDAKVAKKRYQPDAGLVGYVLA
jgi:hypothetical protein